MNRLEGQEKEDGSSRWPIFLKKSLTVLGFGLIIGYIIAISFEEMVLWVGWAMSTRHFSIHMSNSTTHDTSTL